MANCPMGYAKCEGLCHFRHEGYCYYSLPARPDSEFSTTDQKLTDLEGRIAILESKPLPPEQKKQKPKFTGGINVQ